MAALKIYLLGPPRVEVSGTTVELARRKALALLIYLVVNEQPYSRDALATLFYPDYPQSNARAYIRRDLAQVNATPLKAWLATERNTVALTASADLWLDVNCFRQHLADGQHCSHNPTHSPAIICSDCLEHLIKAVDLYQDDFLAGFTLRDCPNFDEWQFFQAESLRQGLAAALEQLVQNYYRQDQPEAAIAYARRWVALDPLHEPARQMLMQAYDHAGQLSAALRQYEAFAELLEVEMGLPPAEETKTLYEAIKAKRLLEPQLKNIMSLGQSNISPPAAPPPVDLAARPFAPADQQLRFTTSADGTRLAYAVVGQGPPLVKVANPLTHLQYDWESPIWRHWIEGLSNQYSLIRYDERGCGLSEREVANFSIEAWVNDLEAVVNAQDLTRFPIIGTSQGASVAVAYAARYPDKVSHLILHCGYVRGRFWREPKADKRLEIETLLNAIRVGWGQDTPAFRQIFATLFVPGGSPTQHKWFCDLARITATPETAACMEEAFYQIDVRDMAPQILAPTLVTHSRGDLMVPLEEGRLLADLIPNARLVVLESNNHVLLNDEPAWSQFLTEVTRFLQSSTPHP